MDLLKKKRIHKMWDELHDFDAKQTEQALDHALRQLAGLVDAQYADWFGAFRLSHHHTKDPIQGWRPMGHYCPQDMSILASIREDEYKRIYNGQLDPSIIENLRDAGTFRVSIKHRLMPKEWYESEFFKTYFSTYGINDAIYTATPIGADIESWFAFQRCDSENPYFNEEDQEVLDMAVRPLKWLHKRVSLLYGLQAAENPITKSERRVLEALLGDDTEHNIAERLGLTQSTVHTYCKRICQKLNVRGRSGLLALWLGKTS